MKFLENCCWWEILAGGLGLVSSLAGLHFLILGGGAPACVLMSVGFFWFGMAYGSLFQRCYIRKPDASEKAKTTAIEPVKVEVIEMWPNRKERSRC